MTILKNGLYKTCEDFPDMQEKFSDMINIYENSNKQDRCKNITFVITEKCNLNCSYCYQINKSKKTMTKKIAKQAVDFILNKELVNGYYDTNETEEILGDTNKEEVVENG